MTSTTHYLVPLPSQNVADLLSRVIISTGSSEQIGKRLKYCITARGMGDGASDAFSLPIHENGVGYYVSGQAKVGGIYLAAFFNSRAAAEHVEQAIQKMPQIFRDISVGGVSISKHTKHIEFRPREHV